MLLVSTRATFDDAEADGDTAAADVFLPPPAPPRQVLLPCPPALDKAGRTELHGVFRAHMPYLSTRAIMPDAGGGGGRGGGGGGRGGRSGDGGRGSERRVNAVAGADGVTYLEVCHEKRASRGSWPNDRGEYLEFSVYKAGRSTHEVAEALCRRLNIKRGR